MLRVTLTSIFLLFFSTIYAQSNIVDSLKKIKAPIDSSANPKSIGVQVRPVKIEFHVDKGQSGYQSVFVTNKFKTTQQFKARFVDWVRDSIGGHHYSESNTVNRSVTKYMSLVSDVLTIQPGETDRFIVKMDLPNIDSVTEKMRWCLLLIETIQENKVANPSDSSHAVVNTMFRVGVHILQVPPKLESKRNIEMVSFRPGKEENSYEIVLKNTGENQLEPDAYIELTSLDGKNRYKLGPTSFPVFPDQIRVQTFSAKEYSIPKGKYNALAVVDAKEDDVDVHASEAVIEVK